MRGDIHLVSFPRSGEGEASGPHPAIIVTSNVANKNCTSILVVPTTTETTRLYNFQIILQNQRTGLDHDSKAQIELLTCVGSWRIKRRIGRVPDDLMSQIDQLIIEHLALGKYTV